MTIKVILSDMINFTLIKTLLLKEIVISEFEVSNTKNKVIALKLFIMFPLNSLSVILSLEAVARQPRFQEVQGVFLMLSSHDVRRWRSFSPENTHLCFKLKKRSLTQDLERSGDFKCLMLYGFLQHILFTCCPVGGGGAGADLTWSRKQLRENRKLL